MKLKSIAAICRRAKGIVLCNRQESGGAVSQYIGTGASLYCITGLPELDEESVLTLFDVPAKQRDDWTVMQTGVPSGIDLRDTVLGERRVERGDVSLKWAGRSLLPIYTRNGIVFIESGLLAPMTDTMDVLDLYEREGPGGKPYLVAKTGFLLQAVMMPVDIITPQLVRTLQNLAKLCEKSLAIDEIGQPYATNLSVDPETGEYIEMEGNTR